MKTFISKFLRHVVTFAVLAACLLVASFAQDKTGRYGVTNWAVNNQYVASQFNYSIDSTFQSSLGSYTFPQTVCTQAVVLSGGRSANPFNTNATVKVNDFGTPANTETVALNSIGTSGNCVLSLAVTVTHNSFTLSSGTCGLKEALNYGGASSTILVTQEFYDQGCTASTITGLAGGATGNYILDISNGKGDGTLYGWTGAAFAAIKTDTATGYTLTLGPINLAEAAAPSNIAGNDTVYADSSAHRVKGKNNGGGASTYALFSDKLNVFAATSSAELAGVISDETGSGLLAFATSPVLTTPNLGTANAGSVASQTANPAASGFIRGATTDTLCLRNAANGADVCASDPGAAAAGTGNAADNLKWNGGGFQGARFIDQSANPANTGALGLGNNTSVCWRNAANGADVCITVDASNFFKYNGSAPTDGSYFVGPENCSMALTTGTFAANPANSGGQSAPAMVRAASGNTVLQLTTTAAANTTDVVCDFSPPTRLTSGKGITITAIQVLYGYQTTALTSIGTLVPNKITYPASSGAAAATVAAIGGALTVTAGTSHGTPGATTTAGQCYSENISFGTPYAHVTDLVRLNWQNTFVQSAAAATVMQICGTIVYYSNINSL